MALNKTHLCSEIATISNLNIDITSVISNNLTIVITSVISSTIYCHHPPDIPGRYRSPA